VDAEVLLLATWLAEQQQESDVYIKGYIVAALIAY